ncbi:LPS export ABC transporter permease LptG [Marinicella rhabdoformis]|uniref:LPS export ABC transporter permease LptG n=1 Tax=Marinicella rhabdoformis TaxID=2580566 RepID=UPI0012AEBBD1|nr:LPS export ABC transporter permease LptG [Marinicella rhabdoformis]
MGLITRYLFKSISAALLLAVLILLSIDVLFALIKELNDISSAYTLGDVFFYVALTIPSKIYELFPVSAVLSVVVGLGALAAGSELVVLMSSGFSKIKIAVVALLSIGFWLALVLWLGEFVAPAGEQMAQDFRNHKISQGKSISTSKAIWLKDGDVVLKTKQMRSKGDGGYELEDVTVFELVDKKLKRVSKAEKATYKNEQWTLENIQISKFEVAGVDLDKKSDMKWSSRIEPEILNISSTRPKYLSLRDIKKYQQFTAQNESMQSAYHIAWWSKWSFPLLVIATAMCGVVMLFGQVRSGGMAQRLVVGIVIGIVIYLLNKTLLNYGEVYHVHPFWVAMLPSLALIMVLFLVLSEKLRLS